MRYLRENVTHLTWCTTLFLSLYLWYLRYFATFWEEKNIAKYHQKNGCDICWWLEKTCNACGSVYTAVSVAHGWFQPKLSFALFPHQYIFLFQDQAPSKVKCHRTVLLQGSHSDRKACFMNVWIMWVTYMHPVNWCAPYLWFWGDSLQHSVSNHMLGLGGRRQDLADTGEPEKNFQWLRK